MFSRLFRRIGMFFLRLADKYEKEQIAKQVPETRINGEPFTELEKESVYATRGCLHLTGRPEGAAVTGIAKVQEGECKSLPKQINFADGDNISIDYKHATQEDLKEGACQYCIDLNDEGKKKCKVCEGTGFVKHERTIEEGEVVFAEHNQTSSVAASQVETIAASTQIDIKEQA